MSEFDATHRCSESECPYFKQQTFSGCGCHKSVETMLREEISRLNGSSTDAPGTSDSTRRSVTSDRPTASATEHNWSEADALQDPVAVHLNMLRGGIAKPSWQNIQHLYADEFAALAAVQISAAMVETGPVTVNEWEDSRSTAMTASAEPDQFMEDYKRDTVNGLIEENAQLREQIARMLVPYWYGGFERQEPNEDGSAWKYPPGTPNARAYEIADKALAALSAAPVSAWQPIETAPKDGTEILTDSSAGIRVARYDEHWKGWFIAISSETYAGGGFAANVTDWMPLPASTFTFPVNDREVASK
ncbi:hypothetical protein [Tardiphaga sp. 367_B4_N1_1]|uniref:hypothetical protein n=1 Tax=Tardiphaga sp. 367_B4_N1_1 TaxID=3240777 RepID=UPI003F23FE52